MKSTPLLVSPSGDGVSIPAYGRGAEGRTSSDVRSLVLNTLRSLIVAPATHTQDVSMPDSRPALPRLPDKARFTENLCQQIEGCQRILQVPTETLAAALKLSPQAFQRRIIRVEDFTAHEIAVCAAMFRTTVSSLVGEEYPLQNRSEGISDESR